MDACFEYEKSNLSPFSEKKKAILVGSSSYECFLKKKKKKWSSYECHISEVELEVYVWHD